MIVGQDPIFGQENPFFYPFFVHNIRIAPTVTKWLDLVGGLEHEFYFSIYWE